MYDNVKNVNITYHIKKKRFLPLISGHQYTPYFPMAPPKWAPNEIFRTFGYE
jgi:hypothetical protein